MVGLLQRLQAVIASGGPSEVAPGAQDALGPQRLVVAGVVDDDHLHPGLQGDVGEQRVRQVGTPEHRNDHRRRARLRRGTPHGWTARAGRDGATAPARAFADERPPLLREGHEQRRGAVRRRQGEDLIAHPLRRGAPAWLRDQRLATSPDDVRVDVAQAQREPDAELPHTSGVHRVVGAERDHQER